MKIMYKKMMGFFKKIRGFFIRLHNLTNTKGLLGSALVIAGVNIGVGMLALPVVTAEAGFFPASVLYSLCCLFIILLARLILEACTWLPLGSNLITIAKTFLGMPGAVACWVIYLFLFYCLLIAHIAAGGDAILDLSQNTLPHWLSTTIYLLIFSPVVYLGTRDVEKINAYLMVGICLAFILFIATALPHLKKELIFAQDWSYTRPALFAVLAAFGFQNLIPTLYTYLKGDHKTLRKAIWIGTIIPLLLYIIWEGLTLGIIPKSDLIAARALGQSAIEPLQSALQNNAVTLFAKWFATLAMSTSFMGMSLAFIDFWADGLKLKKEGLQHGFLMVLVFAIPFIAVLINPDIFITALALAGGIGELLLYGILSSLYIWAGRYFYRKSLSHQFVPGGKGGLVLIFLTCLFCLLI